MSISGVYRQKTTFKSCFLSSECFANKFTNAILFSVSDILYNVRDFLSKLSHIFLCCVNFQLCSH